MSGRRPSLSQPLHTLGTHSEPHWFQLCSPPAWCLDAQGESRDRGCSFPTPSSTPVTSGNTGEPQQLSETPLFPIPGKHRLRIPMADCILPPLISLLEVLQAPQQHRDRHSAPHLVFHMTYSALSGLDTSIYALPSGWNAYTLISAAQSSQHIEYIL